jgi:Uma2 family endonuclease
VTEPAKKDAKPTEGAESDDLDSPFMSMLLTEAPTEGPPLYRMTVSQLDQMVEAGVFPDEARVELINGVLVEMSPAGDGHVAVVAKLHYELGKRLDGRAAVFDQSSFECGHRSLPEPDLVIAPWPYERYYQRRPNATDALVVVEVADSSLRFDRTVKARLYGGHGIPELWIVDLPHRRVHVHTAPNPDGYATVTTLTPDDTIVPTTLPDVEIPVSELRLDLLR